MNNANAGSGGTAEAPLDGFHAALVVSVVAAALGVVAMAWRSRATEASAESTSRSSKGCEGPRRPSYAAARRRQPWLAAHELVGERADRAPTSGARM